MKDMPSHIKVIPPEQERITFECICGSSATFNFPLDMEKNKWWFDNHNNCPVEDDEEIYVP